MNRTISEIIRCHSIFEEYISPDRMSTGFYPLIISNQIPDELSATKIQYMDLEINTGEDLFSVQNYFAHLFIFAAIRNRNPIHPRLADILSINLFSNYKHVVGAEIIINEAQPIVAHSVSDKYKNSIKITKFPINPHQWISQ